MSLHSSNSCMLIESPDSESDEQFLAVAEELLRASGVVRKREEWVRFSAGDRFTRLGAPFRELVCVAGSALARLMMRASCDGGLSRAIIVRGDENGRPCCWEIRGGIESKFEPQELHTV